MMPGASQGPQIQNIQIDGQEAIFIPAALANTGQLVRQAAAGSPQAYQNVTIRNGKPHCMTSRRVGVNSTNFSNLLTSLTYTFFRLLHRQHDPDHPGASPATCPTNHPYANPHPNSQWSNIVSDRARARRHADPWHEHAWPAYASTAAGAPTPTSPGSSTCIFSQATQSSFEESFQ